MIWILLVQLFVLTMFWFIIPIFLVFGLDSICRFGSHVFFSKPEKNLWYDFHVATFNDTTFTWQSCPMFFMSQKMITCAPVACLLTSVICVTWYFYLWREFHMVNEYFLFSDINSSNALSPTNVRFVIFPIYFLMPNTLLRFGAWI